VGDGRGRRKTSENIGKHRKTAGDDGRWWGTVGNDTMSSVLVLGSYLSGKFRKRRDGTTKCRPSSSSPRTDGLPRCEHWDLMRESPRPACAKCCYEMTIAGDRRMRENESVWEEETAVYSPDFCLLLLNSCGGAEGSNTQNIITHLR